MCFNKEKRFKRKVRKQKNELANFIKNIQVDLEKDFAVRFISGEIRQTIFQAIHQISENDNSQENVNNTGKERKIHNDVSLVSMANQQNQLIESTNHIQEEMKKLSAQISNLESDFQKIVSTKDLDGDKDVLTDLNNIAALSLLYCGKLHQMAVDEKVK